MTPDHGADDNSTQPTGLERTEKQAGTDLRDHVYKIALVAAVVSVATATIVYRVAEDWSWVDSFYFSVVAVTTVGFGDLAPTTDFAKLFTVAYIFVGISLIGVVLNERLRRHAQHHAGRLATRHE